MTRAGVVGLGALGAAAAALVLVRGAPGTSVPEGRTSRARFPTPAAPKVPDLIAYIYRRPNETAVRMALGTSPATAREMGIFSSEAKARAVAEKQKARLAWAGVRDL